MSEHERTTGAPGGGSGTERKSFDLDGFLATAEQVRDELRRRYDADDEQAGILFSPVDVDRAADRYYTIVDHSLTDLRLTAREAALIVDALSRPSSMVLSYLAVPAMIENVAAREVLHQKWAVDGHALKEKLALAGPGHCIAIVDALERVWTASRRHSDIDLLDLARKVGFATYAGEAQNDAG